MEHVYARTGLSLAVLEALKDLDLERDKIKVQALLLEVFHSKFGAFKRQHDRKHRASHFHSYYVFENEFPIGDYDRIQYFRSLAYESKIGLS